MVVTQLAHKQIDIIHGLGYGSQLMESPLRFSASGFGMPPFVG